MKNTKRSWCIYFFILATTNLNAMEQPLSLRYSLNEMIQPEYATGKITFVKQFFDKTLVIFDDQCHGELFDSDHKSIGKMHTPEIWNKSGVWCVYKTQDSQNNKLIIAQGYNTMVLYNLHKEKQSFLPIRYINGTANFLFTLWQRPDFSLFIRPHYQYVSSNIDVELTIFPNWDDAQVGLLATAESPIQVETSYCLNEGTVVPTIWYEGSSSIKLKKYMFSA